MLDQISTKATLHMSNYILVLYHKVVNILTLVMMSLNKPNYLHGIMKSIGMTDDEVKV